MEIHLKLTDQELESQFKSCELPPEIFSHEAHLRLAWIHINKYGVEKAVQHLCEQLKNYVNHLGVKDKYNETLTVAAVRAVHHFTLQSNAPDFQSFISANYKLKHRFKTLIFQHYRTDIFNCISARQKYMEPELLPFD